MAETKTVFTNASPVFVVDDLEKATQFYCEVLGFEKKWEWGDPVIRIGLTPQKSKGMGDFELHLINNRNLGPSGTSFIYFSVENVKAIYAQCQQAGAEIYLELGDRDWGMKDFRVADPFGNRLGFGEVL